MDARRRIFNYLSKSRKFLPSKAYLKLYVLTVLMFLLILAALTIAFGRYMGNDVALVGFLIIAGMLVLVFLLTPVFGIILNIIDRE